MNHPHELLHATVNTGHVRRSPRAEVSEAVLEACAPLVAPGRHDIPGCSPYQVESTAAGGGLFCTVWRGREPLVSLAVAPTEAAADAVWTDLERAYLEITEAMLRTGASVPDAWIGEARRPDAPPWCAVVMLPGLMATPPADVGWLGDFERCMAWAWIWAS